MKPLPNQCLASGPTQGPRGQGVGSGGSISRLRLWPFFFFSFLWPVFSFGEKEKGKRTCIWDLQKTIPVFCFRCLSLATRTHSSKLGVTPPASDSTTAPTFCSSHESRPCGMSGPGWHHRKRELQHAQCSFPCPRPPIPPHPSPPTCHSPGPQGHPKKLPLISSPLDGVLGRGFAGEQPMFGERRTEAGGWPSALIRFLGRPGTTVQLCSSERIYWVRSGPGLGGGRKQRMGEGEAISQETVGTGWLWSSELVRNPGCKIPSWVPWGRAPSWASQRGKHPGGRAGGPRKPLWRRRSAHSCGHCPAALQGWARGEKGREGWIWGKASVEGSVSKPWGEWVPAPPAHLCALGHKAPPIPGSAGLSEAQLRHSHPRKEW